MLVQAVLTSSVYLFRSKGFAGGGELDDEVADVVFDTLPLVIREGAPSVLDDILEDLCGW